MRSHDQGFVAAPAARVYGAVSEPSSYATWWPGTRLDGEVLRLAVPRSTPVSLERQRDGVGLYLVGPSLSLEWYLEPFDDGTIVNAFLEIPGAGGRAERRLLRSRGRLRRALVGLHRDLGGGREPA